MTAFSSFTKSLTKSQIAAIIHTDSKDITLNVIDVQMQRGSGDCGLFSLAFAACLASGCQRLFDQGKMRNHLHKCLQKGELTMFPIMKERKPKKVIKAVHTVSTASAECQKTARWFSVVHVTNGTTYHVWMYLKKH